MTRIRLFISLSVLAWAALIRPNVVILSLSNTFSDWHNEPDIIEDAEYMHVAMKKPVPRKAYGESVH
jgi:hypothetical protein